ncbi:MAG: bifunctional histidinol-phosphatase/imidazoleglycerol-phosphate dehydratase HisB [Chitinophagaceae bacterium]|nr:bifunctional histidinol-phosphatase/imidazoleglycerol-phosphate dehydratase HisB [Chitinophagaceae bacterium]
MKKILFIDRDGTLIREAPPSYQIDSFEKLEFYPGVFTWLGKICAEMSYLLVMVSNQDGLGTASFPEEKFENIQRFILKSLENEGIRFHKILIDNSFPEEKKETRKPGIGLIQQFLKNPEYDISSSFVIGDRITDVMLARNAGCKAIWLKNDPRLGMKEVNTEPASLKETIVLETQSWKDIYYFLKSHDRMIQHERKTRETFIRIKLNPDGTGKTKIRTGLHFLDHMLEQLGRHSGFDIEIEANGDLHIDEHHTIEDVAITLGEALYKALHNKIGMERYGFMLPMDDALAQAAVDFGGRCWLSWNVDFKREKIGDVPTEMFFHFFKSLSDAARCNIHIRAEGENEHHKIEAVFKAFARALKTAVRRNEQETELPSTKEFLA